MTSEEMIVEVRGVHKFFTRGSEQVDVLNDLNLDSYAPDTSKAKLSAFEEALKPVLNDRTVEVYSGSAGGNNTGGEVMGLYDIRNDQVLFFGFTNCGSDN